MSDSNKTQVSLFDCVLFCFSLTKLCYILHILTFIYVFFFFIYTQMNTIKDVVYFLKELCVVDNLNDNYRKKLREARNVIEIDYEDYNRIETLRAIVIINSIILDETNDLKYRIEKTDQLSLILIFLVNFKTHVDGGQ